MSEDERPEEERGQDELIAAFAALGGRLTTDELMRLLGSEEYYGVLVRLATLLLHGDTAMAEDVAQDSLAALQREWSRLGDLGTARIYLHRTVVNRVRSIRRYRAISDRGTPQAAPDAPGAGHARTSQMDREPWVSALRTLPDRQLEVVVLHNYLGLPAERAAEVMGISTGAARSHLAHGVSSLRHRPE
jgi:RNA polymerase sigma factor (sigma-70 family)